MSEYTFNGTTHSYTLLDDANDASAYNVKLTSGPYAGVTYKYGEVSVREENDQGFLSWTYQLIDPASFNDKELRESKAFSNTLGDTLYSIMDSQLGTGLAKIGTINADTDTHT
jgi:hypothetical protein